MRGSAVLLVLLVGLTPLAVLTSLVVVPGSVRWQPPLLWKTEVGPALANVKSVVLDTTGLYATGYLGRYQGLNMPAYAFLNKYDFDGHEIWSKQLGDVQQFTTEKVERGSDGLYLAGEVNTTVFVEKHDSSGNLVWRSGFKNITSISALGSPVDIAAGSSGVYAIGLGLGPTGASVPLFLRFYISDGTTAWTKILANVTADGQARIHYSSSSNSLYVTEQDFPQQGVDSHAFLSRYDPAGNLVWTRKFGTGSALECECGASGLSDDSTGLYVGGGTSSGSLAGELSFNGFGSFLRKYDWSGNVVWTTGQPGADIETVEAISIGVYTLTSGIVYGGWVAQRYDGGSGSRSWSLPLYDSVATLAPDERGVYIGGHFSSGDSNGYLMSFGQSSSLIIAGLNPPFSFVVLSILIAIPTVTIVWNQLRRRRLRPRPRSMSPVKIRD